MTGRRKRSRRPRRASADRRADVLAASRKLFAAKGFHATTTRELAEAADINDALLYRYFTDKQAVLAALVDEAIAAFGKLPAAVAETVDPDPSLSGLLERIAEAFVEIASQQVDLLAILISEHALLADDDRFVGFIHLAATGLGARLQAATGVEDGYLVARSFMGSLVAYVLLQKVLGMDRIETVEPDAYIATLVRVTTTGLGAEASS